MTIAIARKAAKAIKKVTRRPVTIKKEGKTFCLCIGYTNDRGDAAYEAAAKAIGYDKLGFGGIEMAADVSGYGVTVVETV